MALKITTKYLAERDEDIRNFSYRKVIEKKLYYSLIYLFVLLRLFTLKKVLSFELRGLIMIEVIYKLLLSQIKSVQIHHFVPSRDKIINKFLFSIFTSINLS